MWVIYKSFSHTTAKAMYNLMNEDRGIEDSARDIETMIQAAIDRDIRTVLLVTPTAAYELGFEPAAADALTRG